MRLACVRRLITTTNARFRRGSLFRARNGNDAFRPDCGPSRGDPWRRALRPEETPPTKLNRLTCGMVGPPRQQAECPPRYCRFPFSICTATSPQNAKRLFDRARFALRCSVSAIIRALASPC